jgi:hypothetical protein
VLVLPLQLAHQRVQPVRQVAFDADLRGKATADGVACGAYFLILSHQPFSCE